MLVVYLGMPIVNMYIFSAQSKLNISGKKEGAEAIGWTRFVEELLLSMILIV